MLRRPAARACGLRRPAAREGGDLDSAKYEEGQKVEGHQLRPGAINKGDWLVILDGTYFQSKVALALKVEKEEIEGGERELCGVLTGTNHEELLRHGTAQGPCLLRLHLCTPACCQLRDNPDLVHARKIKKIMPGTPTTWEKNLIEESETPNLQAEEARLRERRGGEEAEKGTKKLILVSSEE